jgi:hypothetical protein
VLKFSLTWLMSSPHVLGFARLENLSGCTVILGPVSGACYVEGCTDSTIAVCCHQVRFRGARAEIAGSRFVFIIQRVRTAASDT